MLPTREPLRACVGRTREEEEEQVEEESQTLLDAAAPEAAATSRRRRWWPQWSPPPHHLWGEFIGTLLLTTLSSAIGAVGGPSAPFLAGCMVAVLVGGFIPTSGAFFNPFIVTALVVTKRMRPAAGASFVLTQLLAGVAGALVFAGLAPPSLYLSARGGTVALQMGMSAVRGAGWEFFLTATLVGMAALMAFGPFEWLEVDTPTRWQQQMVFSLQIGALVGLLVGVGGPMTGCGMNAARAAGPLLVAQLMLAPPGAHAPTPAWLAAAAHAHWLVYWAAPFAGAVFAALFTEHCIIAPWLRRPPRSYLADLVSHGDESLKRLRNYGLAALIAYGVLNTLFYGTVFTYMALVVFVHQPGVWAKAWLATWLASQATKPLRAILAAAAAPVLEYRVLNHFRRGR